MPLRTATTRPGPDVPAADSTPSLDQLAADARAGEKRITDLEQANRRTAKVLLSENLDQARRIATAVGHGQSVAAFARQAGIEERRAQRLFKLAERSDKIEEVVRAGEDLYGDDYVCPSWKQFLRPEPGERKDDRTAQGSRLGFDALYSAAQTKIAELETANERAAAALTEMAATQQQALKGQPQHGKFGRGDPERETPKWLFDLYDRKFHFDLDVAASAKNAKCSRYFTKRENGLKQVWFGNIWLNPPFAEIEQWCKKAWEFAQTGKGVVVALLPIWPSAPWYRKYAIHGQIRQLATRISFKGTKSPAPFELMIVVWTATSQCKKGRLHVIMEDVSTGKKAATKVRTTAKSVARKKAPRHR
jgi:phage N-6-adenine-methyltransferase